jgi:hypothetical protein
MHPADVLSPDRRSCGTDLRKEPNELATHQDRQWRKTILRQSEKNQCFSIGGPIGSLRSVMTVQFGAISAFSAV